MDAVREHLNAMVIVGAQAVYVHTESADIGIAPYTTDGDLAIDPVRLRREPLLEERLSAGGFSPSSNEVGVWRRQISKAAAPAEPEETVATAAAFLTQDLLDAL